MVKTININKIKKVLKNCPYYDDIMNYDILYDDTYTIDLIDWYKDIIFDKEIDLITIKNIDRCIYMYINDYNYRVGLKKVVKLKDMDLNSISRKKRMIKKILNYNDLYEENSILNIVSSRWL